MDLIADTSLVIALEREGRRKDPGPARSFLEAHVQDRFFITFTIAGELACGESASARREWETLCVPYPVLPWRKEISWIYGVLYRDLKTGGRLIGANDLWIAATALSHQMSLVTDNVTDFHRIPRLEVLSFR